MVVSAFGRDGEMDTFTIGVKVYWKGRGVRGEVEWFNDRGRAWASLAR